MEYDLVCSALKHLVPRAELPTLTKFAEYIDHRDAGGSGFVTVFADEKTPRMFSEALAGDVNEIAGSLNDGREHVGFVVMVEHGRLKWLEGFTYSGNEWPEIDNFELSTIKSGV